MKKKTDKICAYLDRDKGRAWRAYARLNKRSGSQQLEFAMDCLLAGILELPEALTTLDRAPQSKTSTERRAA